MHVPFLVLRNQFFSGSDGAQQLVSTCRFNLVRQMCARSSRQPSLKLTGACGGWVMVMRGAQQNDADGCPLRDASDQMFLSSRC